MFVGQVTSLSTIVLYSELAIRHQICVLYIQSTKHVALNIFWTYSSLFHWIHGAIALTSREIFEDFRTAITSAFRLSWCSLQYLASMCTFIASSGGTRDGKSLQHMRHAHFFLVTSISRRDDSCVYCAYAYLLIVASVSLILSRSRLA